MHGGGLYGVSSDGMVCCRLYGGARKAGWCLDSPRVNFETARDRRTNPSPRVTTAGWCLKADGLGALW